MNKINEYKKLIETKNFKKKHISKFITLLLINNTEKCTEFAIHRSVYDVIHYLKRNTTILNDIKDSFIFDETAKEIKKTMNYLNLTYGMLDIDFGFDIFADEYKMMHYIFNGILMLNVYSKKTLNVSLHDIVDYYFHYNDRCNEKLIYVKNKTFNRTILELNYVKYNLEKLMVENENLKNDKYHNTEDVLAIATKELAKIYNEQSIIDFLSWASAKYCNLINNKIESPHLYTFKDIRILRNKINGMEITNNDFDNAKLKLTESFNSIKGDDFIYGERNFIHENEYFIRKYVMTISKEQDYINYLNRNVIYVKSLLIEDDKELKLELEKLKKEKDDMKRIDILDLISYLNPNQNNFIRLHKSP